MRKISLFVFLLPAFISNAQTWQDTVNQVEKIMSRYKDSGPGAQVAISRNGVIIYNSAKGLADMEHNVPLTVTSKIEAGSVSKQFTAAAILLLEQQGKLSINDDIRKYLPELKDYGYVIHIYHLLHHTSGLKDWGSVIALSGWPRGTRAYNNEDAYHIMCNQLTLNNIPGDEYIYSNSNFTALALIVQKVSGMSHAAFTKKYLFEPAGMKNTEWRDDYERIVPNRAIAYAKTSEGYRTEMPNENTYGHGALLTTVEDLLKWNDYYLSGKLGGPSLLARQTETMPLNNGKKNNYAAGLVVDLVNGNKIISHNGATASYRSQLEYFPDMGLSFAWLSNTSEAAFGNTPVAVRNLFIKSIVPVAPANNLKPDSTISWKKFMTYIGSYSNPKTGAGFLLYSKENGMYMAPNGGPLPVLNENTLLVGRAQLKFSTGNSKQVIFISAAGDTILYEPAGAPVTDEKSLSEYTGTYFSDATESYMYAVMKNGKLVMYPRPTEEEELTSVYKDGFYASGNEVTFVRDKKKAIIGFFVNVTRARKVEFRKVK
jgi:CubicO group peptidase (beta-lactamase class C family)